MRYAVPEPGPPTSRFPAPPGSTPSATDPCPSGTLPATQGQRLLSPQPLPQLQQCKIPCPKLAHNTQC
ncbi:hypothetical protein XENOCAPTIV_027470 [Xenoophorus captivus]|uniref:Uncharacterized protein n=1 Tax=Xenoophorus captivus TaxID=1517983 RepID=A0ABV0SEF6_9TELE